MQINSSLSTTTTTTNTFQCLGSIFFLFFYFIDRLSASMLPSCLACILYIFIISLTFSLLSPLSFLPLSLALSFYPYSMPSSQILAF